ncbi:MAG: hypothetical protein U0Q18_16300 [Bryobacteraceae bacterium]
MAGFLLTTASQVMCSHGGQVTPAATQSRVQISGAPVLPQSGNSVVTGCPLPPLTGSGATGATYTITGQMPCVSVIWSTATTRVTSAGQPLLSDQSSGSSLPGGAPVTIVAGQARVQAV